MFEKPDFSFESATISDEFATLSDDTMTGDDDDKRIVMIGSSDSTNCLGRSDFYGLFHITPSFWVGDWLESLPGFHLELSSIEFDGNREYFPLSGKVFSEFFFCLSENMILLRYYFFPIFFLDLPYFGYQFSGICKI